MQMQTQAMSAQHSRTIAPSPAADGIHTMASTSTVLPQQLHSPTHLHHDQTHSTPNTSTPRRREYTSSSYETGLESDDTHGAGDSKKRKTNFGKRKVSHACVYCRRSHMTCDDGRPCQRCVKRKIAHLCHDDHKMNNSTPRPGGRRPEGSSQRVDDDSQSPMRDSLSPPAAAGAFDGNTTAFPGSHTSAQMHSMILQSGSMPPDLNHGDLTARIASTIGTLSLGTLAPVTTSSSTESLFSFAQRSALPPVFASEHMGNEFAVISDFLASWDGTVDGNTLDPALVDLDLGPNQITSGGYGTPLAAASTHTSQESLLNGSRLSSAERFILTAADPKDGSSEDRLRSIINAKIEAGLVSPYNYVNGYTRLQRWMDSHMPVASRQRILNVMGLFRPMFRSIAQSLTDYDLVMVEESFERLLLEYDRVFSSMGIPACLWRRTGEIWKSNKEFAALVGIPIERLREGKTCIYELMNEDSAINYWEKYGNIAFDAGQKAVLTSCVLRNPDQESHGKRARDVQCCFSFTIRRDRYNIPLLIAGNFLTA
ncbi:hypothetical protein DFS34DRAFT_610170 [Phlyctochytrium arcticum]|nr:hypothetical protein DFS34DRAFT_610170 [Phlyctochytrium arcticum]